MDLIDLIESRRFLGRELLTWLWFESELGEGHVASSVLGQVPLWLESHITLEDQVTDKEQSRLRGEAPSGSPEAREALRQGKLPTQARLRIERGEQAFGFVLAADTLALSSVSIPALLKEEGDERAAERMHLIEELEAILATLYADFLALRLSPAWETVAVPALRAWSRGETIDEAAYRKARRAAVPIGKKAASKAAPKAEKSASPRVAPSP